MRPALPHFGPTLKKKKNVEEEGGRLLGGAKKLTAGSGVQEWKNLWKGGHMAINHTYTACFNGKRPRHEEGIINFLHRSAVIKCIIFISTYQADEIGGKNEG